MRSLSKSDRAALAEAAGFRCQECGEQLNEGWHADHYIPYRIAKDTKLPNMRALCPACNLRKGGRSPMELREHQLAFIRFCNRAATGEAQSRVVVAVAPGAGKGSLPVIGAATLIPEVVHKIAVVVPRDALRIQCAEVFHDQRFRNYFGHHHEIRDTTSDINPSRGTSGFVTSYQSVAQVGAKYLLADMQRHRYALFLDEVHHAWLGGPWELALRPLVDAAKVLVVMSGTLERHDKKQIGFLPYRHIGQRDIEVDTSDGSGISWINCSIADAIRQRAIIPAEFSHLDGAAEWYDRDGVVQEVDELGENREALFAALHSGYAKQLLDTACDAFESRRRRFPGCRLLVVCAGQAQARDMLRHLRGRGLRALIATIDEGNAKDNIRRFKAGAADALVTVQMAYEGLDVPGITHIACLTHIRSAPWILQMIARGWRYDPSGGPYEAQRCFVFVPNDSEMLAVIDRIKGELNRARDSSEGDRQQPGNDTQQQDDHWPEPVVPIASSVTSETRSLPWDGVSMGEQQTAAYQEVIARFPQLASYSPLELAEILDNADEIRGIFAGTNHTQAAPSAATPSERIKSLRNTIEDYIRWWEGVNRIQNKGTCNRELWRYFRKSREDMTEAELKEVWRCVQERYPRHTHLAT